VFGHDPVPMSLELLYRYAVASMWTMIDYRFVLMGFGDAASRSRRLRSLEATLGKRRRERQQQMLEGLVEGGWLERGVLARSEVLYEQGMMISSGWMTSAAVRGWSDREAIPHFAKLGCALFEPYCTAKGKRSMRRVLSGALDEAADA
jgi:hypothetical protein